MERQFGPGPHFLCIGAQKAGTTWLHRNLVQHPEIWLPSIKEIHYFDGHRRSPVVAARIDDYVRRAMNGEIRPTPEIFAFMKRLWLGEPKDDAWYLSLFEFAHGRFCGDMTPAYASLDHETVQRIRRLLPSCRILFVMRDPTERAWSQARMELRRDGVDPASLSPSDLAPYLENPMSVLRSTYSRTVAIWESLYPCDQIRYLFYDQVLDAPDAFLKEVCDFLGLPHEPAAFEKTKALVYNKSPAVPMPPAVRRQLAARYKIEIETLAARFEGPALGWLASCEAALAGR